MARIAATAGIAATRTRGRTAIVLRGAAVRLIDLYRAILSPLLVSIMGPACRFEPTCSAYAREAIARYGIMTGGRLTLGRLARCRPGSRWGHDPVPQERPVGI